MNGLLVVSPTHVLSAADRAETDAADIGGIGAVPLRVVDEDAHRLLCHLCRRLLVQHAPLFLVVVLIETTDLIFAVDSIPAAFAITQNEFLVYTSNIFAVLGLRAMFFLLAGIIDKFYLLQKGLSVILFFIGAKMLLEIIHFEIPIWVSFMVIIATLTLSIIFSIIIPKKEKESAELH